VPTSVVDELTATTGVTTDATVGVVSCLRLAATGEMGRSGDVGCLLEGTPSLRVDNSIAVRLPSSSELSHKPYSSDITKAVNHYIYVV